MGLSVRPVVLCVAVLSILAAPAVAGDVLLTKVSVKEGGASDTVAVAGKVTTPRGVSDPAEVEFRLGTYAKALSAGELVRTTKGLTYKAPKGTKTGLLKFAVSFSTGKFSLSAKGIETGWLDDPAAILIDIGGQRMTALVPLRGSGTSYSWKAGMPLQAVLQGRVLQVNHVLGNTVLGPAADLLFVRNDVEEPDAVVVGGTPETDADGRFELTVEYVDSSVPSRLDLGGVLGEESTLTRPGEVTVTAGDDGVLQVVVFVQKESGAGGTVSPGSPSTFVVEGKNGAPSGTLEVPAGAVTGEVAAVTFTPYAMPAELPAEVPAGWVPLSGAEVSAAETVVFVAGSGPTVTLSRPRWTEKEPLSTADIRLLQHRGGEWQEQPGRGIYDPIGDRFIADPSSPARLTEARPVVYAAKVPVGQGATIEGRVVDGSGNEVGGVTVLSRAGGAVSGRDGSFAVPKSTVSSSALEVVQVIGEGMTTGTVVSASEASGGEVTVEVEETAPPEWMVGVVMGTVSEAGGGRPAAGATVTLSIAGSVRGLLHDTAETPDNFADDLFAVPDLAALGVTAYEWALFLPGQEEEYVSAVYTANTVSPTLLMLEAQAAGRSIPDGAYTVRVTYTIPGLSSYELFGGFRVSTVGIDVMVSDVQVPAGFEGTPSAQVTTNASGQYMKFYRAPQGIPMTATATSAGGNNTNTRTFTFDSIVTVDLEVDGPPPPDWIPVGWSERAPMPTARDLLSVAALNGKIYAVGGRDASGPGLAINEEYDPSTDTWTTKTPMPRTCFFGGTVSLGGLVYVVGGCGPGFNYLTSAAYSPDSGNWSITDSMAYGRQRHFAGAVNGLIIAGGGLDDAGGSDTVEAYDPSENLWTLRSSLPDARDSSMSAVVDGILYLIGGYGVGGPRADAVSAYSITTDAWSSRAPMPSGLGEGACGVIDGEIHVVGGNNGYNEILPTHYIYNPSSDTWRKGSGMPKALSRHGAAVVGGVLYVVGGWDPVEGQVVNTLYAYRPK